ncbi:hypothetical protein JCM11251_003934 [Rhodosporidiobolus azoricus]
MSSLSSTAIRTSTIASSGSSQHHIPPSLFHANPAHLFRQEETEEEDIKPCGVAVHELMVDELDRYQREGGTRRAWQAEWSVEDEDEEEEEETPRRDPDIFFTSTSRFASYEDLVSACAAACSARYGVNMVHNYVGQTRAGVECGRRQKRKNGTGGCTAKVYADWDDEDEVWTIDFEKSRFQHNHPPLVLDESQVEKEEEEVEKEEEDGEEEETNVQEELTKLEQFLRQKGERLLSSSFPSNRSLSLHEGADLDEDDDELWWVARTRSRAMRRLVDNREVVLQRQRECSTAALQARSAALLITHLSSLVLTPTSAHYTSNALHLTLLNYLRLTQLLAVPAFPISNPLVALFLFSRCAEMDRRAAVAVLAALHACQAVLSKVLADEWEEDDELGAREAKSAAEEFVRERPAAEQDMPATLSRLEAEALAEEGQDDQVGIHPFQKVNNEECALGSTEVRVNANTPPSPLLPPPPPPPSLTSDSSSRKRRLSDADLDFADERADETPPKRARSDDLGFATASGSLSFLPPFQLPTRDLSSPLTRALPRPLSYLDEGLAAQESPREDHPPFDLRSPFRLPFPVAAPHSIQPRKSRLPICRLPPPTKLSPPFNPLISFLASVAPDQSFRSLVRLLAQAGCATVDDLFLLAQLEGPTVSLFKKMLELEIAGATEQAAVQKQLAMLTSWLDGRVCRSARA